MATVITSTTCPPPSRSPDPSGCGHAQPVFICNPGDMAGASTVVVTPDANAIFPVSLVQPAGSSLLVTIANQPAPIDRELILLCAPNGDRIVLQYNVATTPPTLAASWNLTANAAYTNSIGILSACSAGADIELLPALDFCSLGVSYTRVDLLDTATKTIVGSIWQDATGAVVPIPGRVMRGVCSDDKLLKTYLLDNHGNTCMADIVLATGSQHISSISFRQMSGTGSVLPDMPSNSPGVVTHTGDTLEFSSSTDSNSFHASNICFVAGDGVQRLSVIYY
jgi:hypothetical protein